MRNPQQSPDAYTRRRLKSGFMLLEVVLALGILGLSSMVLMRSYHLGASTVVKAEIITTAVMLGQGLIDEFTLFPPDRGTSSGDFGEEYPGYKWEVKVERQRMSYRYTKGASRVDDLDDLLTYSVTIRYEPDNTFKPYVPLRFRYHPADLEIFSANAKYENQLLED
jgi:hypothetical protein